MDRIVEKAAQQPPVINSIFDQRDQRAFIDQSQTDARPVGIDARSVTIQEFLTLHKNEIALLATQNDITVNQALQQMYHLGREPLRTGGQGGRHLVDIVKKGGRVRPI